MLQFPIPSIRKIMAELLLLPLVRSVAGKAADALVETVTRMCGLDNDRRTLERQLLAIECKLANAEERSETNNYVKSWMKELKSVAYEANDVLDDFQYEALRRQSKIGMSNSRKVLGYFMHHRPLLFRFEMSKKLKSVLEKINKLVEEMNKFGLENYVRREKEEHPWRQTHSKQDETTQIFGRDDDKEVVVKLLLDQQDQRRVQVLPIIGMGGLGKTTLAKMVYNDQWVQQHFQLKMWHCVSDNFDASALLKSIIELAVSRRRDMSDAIELLQKQLEEVIGEKRFMLVLDDVWNEDERRWENVLKPLLCSIGGPGSIIVVTTRSQKVASIMQTLEPHKLSCLSEQDSWELFAQKAYSNGVDREQAELVTIGRRIVNKCRGLPLALKTMGGLLSSKQKVQEWKAIEGSNIGDNDGGKQEVMPILKLSYKHLSSEMKQCFAFCAVFPKDYQMEKDKLIQLWMANGFIQEEGTIDLKQKGEFIFNELVWRSFLQDKKVEFKYVYGTTEYEIIVCKMHDLMHDLAKVVTNECASIEELTQKKALLKDVCHMQISKAELEQISGLCKGRTNLRTFLAPAESHKDFKEYLLVSASLRALRCSPSSVTNCKATNAKHLRYLDLSWSNITKLPESICVLYNLQTLRLIGCDRLRWLPKDMVRLRKLIHLHLSSCGRLESMSPNFGLLNNLHILTTFVVGTGDGLGIEQLKDLQNLSNRLELLNLNKIKSGENAKEANLSQKQNLSELLFSWHQEIDDEPRDVEEVLECLEPPSNIQKLEIRGYGGLEMSQWMRKPQMFDCLRELKISNCPRCKSIPIVWFSTSLEILFLQKMDNLITLCNSLDMEAGERVTPQQIFPKLKKMRLIELPSLEIWAENSVREPQLFNCLEELEMSDCPRCKSIPPVWFSVSLEILSLRNMDNLTTLCNNLDVEVGGHFTPLQIFPRLKKMRLIDLPSLEMCAENSVGQPSDFLVVFPMLEKLRIKNCPKLASIPVIPMINKLRIVEVHSGAISLVFMCIRSGFWPFLTKLTLGSSPEDIPMLSIDAQQSQSQRPLEKLTYLYLEGFNSLVRSSELSRSQLTVWKCFSFVEELRIYSCFNLVRWPSEELRCLVRLRFLDITSCDSLEGSTSSSEEETLPLSLEEFLIEYCGRMVALPSNIGKLAKLRRLYVNWCSRLKALPDGMCGLTSLRTLTIGACAVEEFPHGLLERLPALEYLSIDSCPELERRCIEGGEYFHLLSSVPSKWIRQ